MHELQATDFAAHARRRAWFIALQAILALCGVVLVLALRDETTYSRTTNFVLHPDNELPAAEVPEAIDVLDGSLVQTVLRVVNSGEIVDRAAAVAGVEDTSGITIDVSVQPGSAYYDATVSGSNDSDVEAISRTLPVVASRYVDESYTGYELETLGTSSATDRSFPPSPAVVTLSLLLGALLGVALVFVEWVARRLNAARAPTAAPPIEVPVAAHPVDVPAAAIAAAAFDAALALDAKALAESQRTAARKPRTTKPRTGTKAAATTGSTPSRKPRSTASRAKSATSPDSERPRADSTDLETSEAQKKRPTTRRTPTKATARAEETVEYGPTAPSLPHEISIGDRAPELEPLGGNGRHDGNGGAPANAQPLEFHDPDPTADAPAR